VVVLTARDERNRRTVITVGRSVIGLCGGFGLLAGGYVPELWGSSAFSFTSLLFSLIGAAAGIWLGVRLTDE
jgi:hypothetical protein